MGGRAWKPHETDFLRLTWPDPENVRYRRVLAEVLGRTVNACSQRAFELRLHVRRGLTDPELGRLAALWPGHTVAQIAAALGATPAVVKYHARRIGLPPPVRSGGAAAARIAELAADLTDREIAEVLGLDRTTVREHRRRAGLPPSRAARRRLAVAAWRRRVDATGQPLGRLRSRRHAELIAARGWPPDLPLRAVLIIESLCDHGPADRVGLAARLGRASGRSLTSHKGGNNRTLPQRLEAAGLVHGVPGPDRRVIYFPTTAALAVRAAYLKGVRDGDGGGVDRGAAAAGGVGGAGGGGDRPQAVGG